MTSSRAQAFEPSSAAVADAVRPAEFAEDDERTHLAAVAAQLEPQLPDRVGTLVLIPTVGFGAQSHRVLPATVRQLAEQRTSGPVTVVVLVNRPEHRAGDGTEELVRREIASHGEKGPRFAVASIVVRGRPRMGCLRQLLFDAVALCTGGVRSSTAVVVGDDDIVHAPPGALETLADRLRTTGCNVALGPVLFDDEQTPSVLLADFFVADVLRALLAARWISQLQSPRSASAAFWQQYAEAIALSGNMAVRSSALVAAGGFPPFNEITGVVRQMHFHSAARAAAPSATCQPAEVAGTWDFDPGRPDVLESLLDSAVRLSSRRALRAFATSHAPSVAQWLVCRFHASRIDPARQVPEPFHNLRRIDRLGRSELERLVDSTAALVGTTLGFFPPDAGPARDALRAIGLDSSRCTAEPAEREGTPWRVRIHDPGVMLDRVLAAQCRLLDTT